MVDVDESWVREWLQPRYPELVAPYLEAVATTRRAKKVGLGPQTLSLLVSHARSPRKPLGENVATMIGELANRFEAARDAIRTLASDTHMHVRINALVALESHRLSPLHAELLAVALEDKSTNVRTLAADKIRGSRLRKLLPQLEQAIARESKPSVRSSLEWARDLLRDGYRVERHDNGRLWVTCHSSLGVVSTTFSADEFESKGRQWITSHLKDSK